MQDSNNLNLTIITLTYNSFNDLYQTFKSINFCLKKINWIVVDGGNCRRTNLFMKKIVNENIIHINEPDNGIYDAMSKGISYSNRKFTLFLNSGDELISNLNLQSILDEGFEYDVIYTSTLFLFPNGTSYIRKPRNPKYFIYHSVPGNHQGTFFKTTALKKITNYREYSICGDYAMSCELFMNNGKLLTLNVLVSKFYIGGASTKKWLLLLKEAVIIQRYILKMNFIFILISLIFRFFILLSQYIKFKFEFK